LSAASDLADLNRTDATSRASVKRLTIERRMASTKSTRMSPTRTLIDLNQQKPGRGRTALDRQTTGNFLEAGLREPLSPPHFEGHHEQRR
jgi:hypothetical protein